MHCWSDLAAAEIIDARWPLTNIDHSHNKTPFHLCKAQLTETEIRPMKNMNYPSICILTQLVKESQAEIINEGGLAISDR